MLPLFCCDVPLEDRAGVRAGVRPHFGGVGARSGSHHFCLRSAELSAIRARDTGTSVEDPSALLQVLARDTREGACPWLLIPFRLRRSSPRCEVKAAKELAQEYGWADDHKDYVSMLHAIRKRSTRAS